MTRDPTACSGPRLELERYGLRRRVRELQVDATFAAGVNVLLGVNGVGKTTLLTSLVNPRLRSPGSVARLVHHGSSRPLDGSRLCLMPQHPTVPGHLTVIDLVRYCCHLRGARVEHDVLHEMGLAHLTDRRADRLSGGEAQRVNLLLAFVGSPAVVLLDEPTVALDPLARARFVSSLRAASVPGTVVVMSTHVPSDIDVADRVHVLTPHGITWSGTGDEFLDHDHDRRFEAAFAALLGVPLP